MSKHGTKRGAKTTRPKSKLGLPDLDHSKAAVVESLRSRESKRGYRHAIDEFIQWYPWSPSFGLFWTESSQVLSGGIWSSTNGSSFTGSVDNAIRLDAAPEPASWALLGCGLLGLAGRRRRANS